MASIPRVDSGVPNGKKADMAAGQSRRTAVFAEMLRKGPGPKPAVMAPPALESANACGKQVEHPAHVHRPRGNELADDEPAGLVRLGDVLDPLVRSLATTPGPTVARSAPAPTVPPGLEELVSRMAKKLSWGSDGRRATACLELGEGPLAGTTVMMSLEGKALELTVELPSGVCPPAWQERIRQRLEGRGFELAQITVR
jgi:hypothetical protein